VALRKGPERTHVARKSEAKPRALSEYERKRDFSNTPEPSGERTRTPAAAKPRFVIQRHRATRLHYDFRLEADGVLKSWAVPKGPSLDPKEKRLAMMVEDHPLDYRDFEGNIPKGNYGAGDVIVWDRGTYKLLEGTDVSAQIAKGSLKFELSGKKLHGAFALVHIKGRGGEENAWLLIKEHDRYDDPAWKIDDYPESVKTGRTNDEVRDDPKSKEWLSKKKSHAAPGAAASARQGSRLQPVPAIASPMLATLVDSPFDDAAWLYEIKWDGYRAIATIDRNGGLTLHSRNGKDLLEKLPELQALPEAFSERPIVVDGEICVIDAQGRPSFGALQERLDRFGRAGKRSQAVTFVVFDLLYGGGRDRRREPLERRKAMLESILTGNGPVLYSKHVIGKGTELFAFARDQGLEGIMAKRRDSAYTERRSRDWAKIKAQLRQEVVIGGWTEPRGSRKHFGALLAGLYEGEKLIYAGSVGTGFDARKLEAIAAKLRPLERKTSPFAVTPKTDSPAHFVRPQLVAEIALTEWTRDGSARHPVFVALRDDKDPRGCVRETPKAARDVA
jgi:bifunctional non-homologous end joining protein LigD